MKRVLLHTIFPECLNGPNSVNACIRNSEIIKNDFEIVDLFQTSLSGKNPIKFVKIVNELRREIKAANADAIIVTGLQFAGFVCTTAAKLAGIKNIIVCVHGYSGDAQNISSVMRFAYSRIVEPLTLKMATTVYSVCEYGGNREMIKKHAKNKFYGTIHNCFPPKEVTAGGSFRAEYGIADDETVAVNVSRVVYDKGHADIIAMLQKGLPSKTRMVIVGDGPYIDEYEKECSDLLQSGQLILTGQRSDVLNILQECDIFLFPSHHENLSMAMLEACFSKCAIIAYDVDGNPEVVKDGQTGRLVPFQNIDLMYDILLDLINHPDQVNEYAMTAYRYAEQEYSYDVFQNRINTMLKKTVGREQV